jgi:hypothetical protein
MSDQTPDQQWQRHRKTNPSHSGALREDGIHCETCGWHSQPYKAPEPKPIRITCVVCQSTEEWHYTYCAVTRDSDEAFFGYSRAVGDVDIRNVQQGSGIPTLVGPGVVNTVQLQKCGQCCALVLPLDTSQHNAWHDQLDAALIELQRRTDRRPPDKRRLTREDTNG